MNNKFKKEPQEIKNDKQLLGKKNQIKHLKVKVEEIFQKAGQKPK